MKRFVTIALVMIAAVTYAGGPQAGFELVSTTYSPKRTFQIEHYFHSGTNHPSNYYWQHWVTDGKSADTRILLYESDGQVETLISPDDTWIVLNDRRGSDDMEAILFRKSADIIINAVTNIDLKTEAFQKAVIQQGFSESQGFDHAYCEAMCWLDSRSLVLHVWGHDSRDRVLLNDWYCIYDITSRKVSFDLTTVNTRAFNGASPQITAKHMNKDEPSETLGAAAAPQPQN